VDAWADAAQRPGRLFLDAAPLATPEAAPGVAGYAAAAGFLARDVSRQADLRHPLVVLGQHRRCHEALVPLQEAGLSAAVFPMRGPDNCKNFAEASRAARAGLPASMAVCPGCPERDGCDYLEQEKLAKDAEVLLMRASRASASLENVAEGRDAVLAFVPERSCELFSPYATARLPHGPVGEAAAALEAAAIDLMMQSIDDAEAFAFWKEVRRLINAVRRASPRPIRLRNQYSRPAGWAKSLWRLLGKGPVTAGEGAAVRILLAGAAGELRSLMARPDGDAIFVAAAWKPRLPAGVPVAVWDYVGGAADLRKAARKGVTEISSPGPEPRRRPVRITRHTRASECTPAMA
jgi:hypothetical protein